MNDSHRSRNKSDKSVAFHHELLKTPNHLMSNSGIEKDSRLITTNNENDWFHMPHQRPFVPVTPSIARTPFLGNIHRRNSGFAVPETPCFVSNQSRVMVKTVIEETPLIRF